MKKSQFEMFTIYGTKHHFKKAEYDLKQLETRKKWFGCYWRETVTKKPIIVAPNGKGYDTVEEAIATLKCNDPEEKYLK